MKDLFVPYNLSLKLEEIGFNEECIATIDQTEFIHIKGTRYPPRGSMVYNEINCPTWDQVFDWFDDRYNLFSYITIVSKGSYESTYSYTVINHSDFIDESTTFTESGFKSKEEVREACLEKLIQCISI